MKSRIQIILLLLFCAVAITSCNQKKEKVIARKWKVETVNFMNPKDPNATTDNLDAGSEDHMQSMITDMVKKTTYDFHEDGTYEVSTGTFTNKGKWELKEDGTKLVFTNIEEGEKDEKVNPITIEELNDDKLIMLLTNDQTSMNMKLELIPF